MHVFAQQAVRADDNVDLTLRGVGDDLLVLLCTAEAAHHINDHRELCHALFESVEMLLAENRRRH